MKILFIYTFMFKVKVNSQIYISNIYYKSKKKKINKCITVLCYKK